MRSLAIAIVVLAGVLIGLNAWRWSDMRSAARVWDDLTRGAEGPASSFDPSMVDGLPEPARRFFLYTIQPRAPIRTATELRMSGEIGLGTRDQPNYVPMQAEQILAPPFGLVWRLRTGGMMRISGSDGFDGKTSWVRFWLMNTIPMVRVGGTRDHALAAFGRVVAEAVIWAPASLLPQNGVVWEAIGTDVARATIAFNGMTQTVDVTLAEDGRPIMVVIPRWSDANPEKSYRYQPFGGYLSEFRDFSGYRLATHVEGGNFIGTDDYFPFYRAHIDALHFIGSE